MSLKSKIAVFGLLVYAYVIRFLSLFICVGWSLNSNIGVFGMSTY